MASKKEIRIKNIESKIHDAMQILTDIQFDNAKKIKETTMAVRVLLTGAGMTPTSKWTEAKRVEMSPHFVLEYIRENFDIDLKENTREAVRKSGFNKLYEAAILTNNREYQSTNSSNVRWWFTDEFLNLLKTFGTSEYGQMLSLFLENTKSRLEFLAQKKDLDIVPIRYGDQNFKLSFGTHNELHKAILEEFAPRFAPGSKLLYLGDTSKKDLYVDSEELIKIGFPMNMHDVIPDVVLLDERKHPDGKKWVFLIEATDSVGPMSLARVNEIKNAYSGTDGLVFVTAFRTFQIYTKFAADLAWDTEVWIAENPTHMIHLNGDRFMGPRYD